MSDKKYTVRVTRHAKESLREISNYIKLEKQAPMTATNWARKTKAAIQDLSSFPEKNGLTPDEPWLSLGVHRMVHGNFYVYYMIFENDLLVRVVDIIYQRRDQVKALSKTPLRE